MPGHTDPTLPTFGGGAHGWDGTQWRKLALLWGYSGGWQEDLSETKSGDGNFVTVSTPVPSGYVYVLECATIRNDSGARSIQAFQLRHSGEVYPAGSQASPEKGVPFVLVGQFTLSEGDIVAITQNLCLDGDVIIAGVWGYKMAIAE